MLVKTFEATVAGGRLEHEQLEAFEGCRVQVTVATEQAGVERSTGEGSATEPAASDEDGPEPPEWMDVEVDVYVRMPVEEVILKDVKVIDMGPAPPCMILPEELPDD